MASYAKLGHENWQARIRITGEPQVSESGFRTKSDAQRWAEPKERSMRQCQRTFGEGPERTNFAVALRDYAFNVTAGQGGCEQALCKINKYLVAAGMKPLKATKLRGGRVFIPDEAGNLSPHKQEVQAPLFDLVEFEPEAVFQNRKQMALSARERSNLERHNKVQPFRIAIARTRVSDLAPHHFAAIKKSMTDAGYGAATIRQELAILSGFYTHAKKVWSWQISENPLLQFDWPTPEPRERVASKSELERLAAALLRSQNKVFVKFVLFALETAMRKGESISTACWCDLDVDNKVLKLPHSKSGRRNVPLSPTALDMLKEMKQGSPTDRIFELSVNELDNCWKRLCLRATVSNFHIHDLRHTSATMYAVLLNGDIFALQKITGHKTLKALQVYINLAAEQVSSRLEQLKEPTIAQTMRVQMTRDCVGQDASLDVKESGKVEQLELDSSVTPERVDAETPRCIETSGVTAFPTGNVVDIGLHRRFKAANLKSPSAELGNGSQ